MELARETLKDRNLSLVIAKGGRLLFDSRSWGINGLLQAVEKLKEKLHGSSVADRVVGRAAALLLASSRVKQVYALVISGEGLKVLNDNDIPVEHENLVPQILDREGKDVCPFERFSLTIRSLDEACDRLKAFAENLRREKDSWQK